MNPPVDENELATRELARRLTPYVATERAWSIAAEFVTDLLARGWRPPLDRPPKLGRKGDYARGAALARELLGRRLEGAHSGDTTPAPEAEARGRADPAERCQRRRRAPPVPPHRVGCRMARRGQSRLTILAIQIHILL